MIYVQLTKAMYGTIRAARLWWENLSCKLLDMRFEFNPYDLCVTNREINGKQCTLVWHVDDLKVSHVDPELVIGVLEKLSDKYGEIAITRGREHTYVGMNIKYNNDISDGCMSLRRGMVYSKPMSQKLTGKSSTEAEIIGVSDLGSQIFWTLYFLRAQGYNMENRLFQDNLAARRMEMNGRRSSGSRTRHINIRYFFIKDRCDKGEVTLIYCPTEKMVADYHTKPLQGKAFINFRD